MTDQINEKVLLYRVLTKRDPDAFAELYDLYVKRIYRFVFFKVGSAEEAEDITSDVFLRAWDYIINNSNKEVKSFSGLLYRVARNLVIDSYRRRSTQPIIQSTDDERALEIGDGGKWYANLFNQIEAKKIIASLKKLKQEYQEVITLRYVDELEINEISEIMGKSGLSVRVTLHRAINKLKEILEK